MVRLWRICREGYLFREGSAGRGYYKKEALARKILEGQAPQASPATRRLYSAAASPGGTTVATSSMGSQECVARVWRQQPGGLAELQRRLAGHSAVVLALAFSPCGTLLFTGSYDQTIRVWQGPEWGCVRVLKGHGGGIRAGGVDHF